MTDADLNYIGSITIDVDLMQAANLIAGEKVQVVNINNGERLETYVIPGKKSSGEIALNGPAARRWQKETLSSSFHTPLWILKKLKTSNQPLFFQMK